MSRWWLLSTKTATRSLDYEAAREALLRTSSMKKKKKGIKAKHVHLCFF